MALSRLVQPRGPTILGVREDRVGVERHPVPAQRELPGVVDVDVEGIKPWWNGGMRERIPDHFLLPVGFRQHTPRA